MIINVEITETLQKIVTVEVDTDIAEEAKRLAIETAKEMYDKAEIVLDSDDYIDTEFEVVE